MFQVWSIIVIKMGFFKRQNEGTFLWMSVDTESMFIAGKYSMLNTEHNEAMYV